ncbi:17501_t:CDS:2 [Entrophospora sp. SA101]|nr:17501_t:CDS:2 [Entrophospora sp. SA101]
MTEADNPETIQSVCKKFEAMLKQQSVIDSGSECPIITYEVAKKLGFEKDKSLSNITDKRYLALLSKWQRSIIKLPPIIAGRATNGTYLMVGIGGSQKVSLIGILI